MTDSTTTLGNAAFRDFVVDGVSGSGINNPAKADARAAIADAGTRLTNLETGKAPLASPALTGSPTAPTPSPGDNTTKLPTTAFVTAAVAVETSRATTAEGTKAPLASPTFTGTPAAPTPSPGDNTTKIPTTAFVAAAVAVEAATARANETALGALIPSTTPVQVGVASPVASGSLSGTLASFFLPTASTGQYLNTLSVGVPEGQQAQICIGQLVSGGTAITLVGTPIPIQLAVGVNVLDASDFGLVWVPSGLYVGVYLPRAAYYTGGGSFWSTTGIPGTATTKSNGSVGIQLGFTFTSVIPPLTAAFPALQTVLGSSQQIGPTPVVGSGPAGGTTSLYLQDIAPISGTIVSVEVFAPGGTCTFLVGNLTSGPNIADQIQAPLTTSGGYQKFTTNIPISEGQLVGAYGAINYDATLHGDGAYFHANLATLGTPTSVTQYGGYQIQLRVTIVNGLTGQLAQLGSAADPVGLTSIGSADPTGVADATAIVAAAFASKPTPYFPPGRFSLTSIPNYGKGGWGPGVPVVNGVDMAMPTRPEYGVRWLKMRARLALQLFSGSSLIINSASGGNGYNTSNFQKMYSLLLCRFANMGISVGDETVYAQFDPTDVSGGPAFHGVTISGTIVNGTHGPIANASLMLQPGQIMTFVGAYAQVDVTYQQATTAGTLSFAYNGTPYGTPVVCAGSALSDVSTNYAATGQTASGTYTITNTHGSAAVEITSLIRLGPKTGTLPRLYVCNFAHGGYAFRSFGATQAASALRISTNIGGGTTPFLINELGANDEVGLALSYSDMYNDTTTYLGLYTGAIKPHNILPIMPWRWSTYAAGGNYERGIAAMREAFSDAGVPRLAQSDGYDLIQMGLAIVDGHPNDAGNALFFNLVVESLCAG